MTKHLSSANQALKNALTGKIRSNSPINNERFYTKNIISSVTIPTSSGSAEEEEVDISQYTKEDLERLRLEDPFLYYSIPAKKQELYGSESSSSINHSDRSYESTCPSLSRSSCQTISSDIPANDSQHQQRRESVTRARRLSTEPHHSVVTKQIMDEMGMNEEFNDSDMDEEDEKLLQALKNGTFDA